MKRGSLIMIILAVLILGGGGGAGVFFADDIKHFMGMSAGDPSKTAKAEPEKPAPKPLSTDPSYYDMPDITVSLDSRNIQGNRILRLALSLQLANKEDNSKIQSYLPRIQDALQVYLRDLPVAEIKGPESIRHLRPIMLDRINAVIAPTNVEDVLFREVLVQ